MNIFSIIRQRNIQGIFDVVENFGTYFCRYLQTMLVGLIFILFFIFSNCYLNDIFLRSRAMRKELLIGYFCVGIFALYNLVYNYVLAHRIGPGHPSDIGNQALFQNNVHKKCKKCKWLKPVRTHHCSICNSCNLQMDHHCPWMGTCIGHYNRRYFINFLTYLTFCCVLVTSMITQLHLPHDDVYMFLYVIAWTIGCFTLYHWSIMLVGRTTLQSCTILDAYSPKTYSFMNNFQIVYGTKNIVLALLPFYTPLTYKGFEWNQNTSKVNSYFQEKDPQNKSIMQFQNQQF